MKSLSDFDAIIVGAGLAGSSTAILLSRAGWSVALLEKQRFPRRKVCGECIAASNIPLLHELGIGEQFSRLAGPEIRRMGFMYRDRTLVTDMPAAANDRFPWGRALGRETLDTMLRDQARLDGVQVFQPFNVESIEGGPGHWRCHARMIDSDRHVTLRAAVVVDAHGSWESLRAQRGEKRLRSGHDLIAFKANFRGGVLADGVLPVLAFAGGYGGMIRADAGNITLACCIRRDFLEGLRGKSPGLTAGEVVEQYIRVACRAVNAALAGATQDGPWIASGPLRPGIRVPAPGQPFLVGNAAGEAHPIIGEGMSMALQSAFMLSAALTAHGPALSGASESFHDRLNRRYAAQWHRAFASRLRLASMFAYVAMRPVSSSLLMTLATRFPSLMQWGARRAGKTRSAVGLVPTAALEKLTHSLPNNRIKEPS